MIKLLLLDVDGVLTDGTITYDPSGRELKSFNVKDGYGIVRALNSGVEVAVVSGRHSFAVEKRCRELKVRFVFQGVDDKLKVLKLLSQKLSVEADEVAAMGDDLPDLPLLRRVAISGAPADAVEDVKKEVSFVSRFPGGRGAVREFIDHILELNAR